MILKYTKTDNKYNKIKQVAKEYFHMSDRLVLKLKNKQLIFKNSKTARVSDSIENNDIVEFNLDYEEESDNIVPIKMNLEIIYEDDSFIIVNKPPFMPVHPSANHYEDSLSNGIKCYFNSINLHKKIRPVNRLDKNTSGLVIFAKNEYVQESLINQMKHGTFKKKYLAILDGILKEKSGTISAPIARKEKSIIEREVNFEKGQNASTSFNVISQGKNFALVEFELHTGRTHQIRVHAKYMSHPILGDSLYGSKTSIINRQALHCYSLSFLHPIKNKNISFKSNIPTDMKDVLRLYVP